VPEWAPEAHDHGHDAEAGWGADEAILASMRVFRGRHVNRGSPGAYEDSS
jgi:hypothetical protein